MNLIAIIPSILFAAVAIKQNVPEHNNWRLTVECDAPKAIVVPSSTGGVPRTVWVVTFTVKNQTGAAHTIAPFIQLTTETNKTIPAGYDTDAAKTFKFYNREELTDLYEMTGGIEDGATKRGVAYFDGVDPFANHYTLHFEGFASQLWRKGKEFTQQNVEYQTTFHRAGNEHQICSAQVKHEKDTWVTLATKKVR